MADTTENTTTTTSTGCLVKIEPTEHQTIIVYDANNKGKVINDGDTVPVGHRIRVYVRADEGYEAGAMNYPVGLINAPEGPITVSIQPATPIPEGEEAVLLDGTHRFATIVDALELVKDTEPHTIEVKKDIKEPGFLVNQKVQLTINLNGHSLIFIDPLVGSIGYETNCIRSAENAVLNINNGTLKVDPNIAINAYIIIQNYSNLTLTDVTVDGTAKDTIGYAVSNNYCSMTLKGNTVLKANPGAAACDCWFGLYDALRDKGPQLIMDKSFTGVIDGNIEYGGQVAKAKDDTPWYKTSSITIDAPKAVINSTLVNSSPKSVVPDGKIPDEATIKLENGVFTKEVDTRFVSKDKKMQKVTSVDGTVAYKVVEPTEPSVIESNSRFGPTLVVTLFELWNMR